MRKRSETVALMLPVSGRVQHQHQPIMKPQPGTYGHVLSSSMPGLIRVGRLGGLQLQPGFYVYIGSAHGPGGLRARLAHHLGPTSRPHGSGAV